MNININSTLTLIIYNCLSFIDRYLIYILIIVGAYYLILSVSMAVIYKKTGQKPIKAIIPIYNLISFLNYADLPFFMVILFLIPYVNIFGLLFELFIVNPRIVRSLNRSVISEIGSIIFPFVVFPLIALRKNLVYQKISEQNVKVKTKKEEKKDELDIPEVDIDIPNIEAPTALSMDAFKDEIENTPVTASKQETLEDGVADLTFDYNSMYSNNSVSEIESKDDSLDILAIPTDSVEEPISDIPVAPVEELPQVAEQPVEVEAVPEVVEPIEEKVETPVIEDIPQVEESISDIPVAPVEELPQVAEQPVEVETVPEVVEPIEEKIETPVVEDIPQVEEPISDIPVAPVEEIPQVVEQPVEVETVPEVVEPIVEIPEAPIDNQQSNEMIESIVEEPIEDIQSLTPPIKTPDDDRPDLPSEDGYTFDYNAVYNVTPEENPVEETKNDENKDELLDSFIADAPSFEITEEEPVEEVVEQQEEIPEVSKEDLVSINIDEPSVLPVGKRVVKNNRPARQPVNHGARPTNNVKPNNMVRPDLLAPQGGVRNQNVQQGRPVNGQAPRQQVRQGMTQGRPNGQGMRPVPGQVRQVQGRPVNGQVPRQQVRQGMPQGRLNGQGMRQQPMQQHPAGFNPNNGPLLRPNEGTRAQQRAAQPRQMSKFINDTQTEFSYQRKEVPRVQQPTDPTLRANPMAIFGASNNALRPTSSESLRKPRRAVCPGCGFAIKPGQPVCLVCGRRLR